MRRYLKLGVLQGSICGKVAVWLMAAVLGGCVHEPPRLQTIVEATTRPAHDCLNVWQTKMIDVNGWTFATVWRSDATPARVYIEGDGRAYITRSTPSGDPTPLNAVGLDLALRDSGGAMYVGRPCQWVRGAECRDRTLWTEKRFSQPVIDRYVALVARVTDGRPVELVGYSGGAWVALQVAARLENVTKVTTVAGNLMPNWVNAQHKVTKMDIVDYPQGRLAEVPVVAYVGVNDKIVGKGVVEAYVAETGARDVKVVEIDAEHGKGWDAVYLP